MGFSGDVRRAAETIRAFDEATIISHIDADGISSEAILAQALAREGITARSVFVRQLEPMAMRHVPTDSTLKIFVDLGAGQQNLLEEHGLDAGEVLIVDHHVSQPCDMPYPQVNCLDYGHQKLSAAGIAYLIAKEMDRSNIDLAKLAVVGNVGDMMARETRGLTGLAREIAMEGVAYGNIIVRERDLNCYGTSTRPVQVCLAYSDDPYIPGISNSTAGALRFLQKLDVALRADGGRWYVWEELPMEEKRTIISALVQQLVAHGKETDRLFAETYLFPDEMERTPLRNASEYATLLNACGRWAKPRIGSSVCRGDRGTSYQEAEYMLRHHRTIIRELLQYILETGVTELSHLQYICTGDRFPDTIIGIGAGMALSKLNWQKPIMILGDVTDDPEIAKVSMRTNEWALRRGIDLQQALMVAAEEVGGAGGGHRIAAGAYIPKTVMEEFADRVNSVLEQQLAETCQDDC
ncbi:MAG: DHH family phosphoesterase [Methanomicrobiaceae archaeon]|nr:DHH family phosphoesterase [Methanomicrobiaceae archaeon]